MVLIWLSVGICSSLGFTGIFTSVFLIVWFVSNGLLKFVFFDRLLLSSNRMLLMVIGSCFSQFTPSSPSSGVILFLCVISSGDFVVSLLFSVFTDTFSRNLVSVFVHAFVSLFQRLNVFHFGLYDVGLFGMVVTLEPVKFWYFPFIFVVRRNHASFSFGLFRRSCCFCFCPVDVFVVFSHLYLLYRFLFYFFFFYERCGYR